MRDKNEEKAYRVYISDSIQAQAQGKYIVKRWIDLINPDKNGTARDADEIALDVIKKLGLKFRGEGGDGIDNL